MIRYTTYYLLVLPTNQGLQVGGRISSCICLLCCSASIFKVSLVLQMMLYSVTQWNNISKHIATDMRWKCWYNVPHKCYLMDNVNELAIAENKQQIKQINESLTIVVGSNLCSRNLRYCQTSLVSEVITSIIVAIL